MSTLGEIIGQFAFGVIAAGVLSAVLGEELRTRLNLLPRVLIRLSARHLPADMRGDRIEEWNAELAAITDQTEGLPLTRFLRELTYALSLFVNAGALTSALTGRPRIRLTLAAGRRTLTALTHLAAGCYVSFGIAVVISDFSDPAFGFSWRDVAVLVWVITTLGCLAVGAMLQAVWQYALNVRLLQRTTQRLGVMGFGLAALGAAVYNMSAIKNDDDLGILLGTSLLFLGCVGLAYVVARGIASPAVVTASIIFFGGSAWTSEAIADACPLMMVLMILMWKSRNRIPQKFIRLLSIKSGPRPCLAEHEDESV